MKLLIEMKKKT